MPPKSKNTIREHIEKLQGLGNDQLWAAIYTILEELETQTQRINSIEYARSVESGEY